MSVPKVIGLLHRMLRKLFVTKAPRLLQQKWLHQVMEKSVSVHKKTAKFTFLILDIPLYMACPCRSSPARVGQLMRLHVVTPKAPIHVALCPKVVPFPDGPVFYPGWQEPVKLPMNTYWVLRFPLIYRG